MLLHLVDKVDLVFPDLAGFFVLSKEIFAELVRAVEDLQSHHFLTTGRVYDRSLLVDAEAHCRDVVPELLLSSLQVVEVLHQVYVPVVVLLNLDVLHFLVVLEVLLQVHLEVDD